MSKEYEVISTELQIHLLEALVDKPSAEVKKALARGRHFVNVISKKHVDEIDNHMKVEK